MLKLANFLNLNISKKDNFRNVQDYFHDKNIDIVRTKFKIRMQMVENILENLKNMYYWSKAIFAIFS